MLVKKGNLVKHTLFGWTGIVTEVDNSNNSELKTCEVHWMLDKSSVGLTKISQRRWEQLDYLIIND